MNHTSLRDRLFTAPPQPVCDDIRRLRYAQANEQTADDIRRRLAQAFASVEPTPHRSLRQHEFLSAMRCGFIPGGRIHAAAGTQIAATLINCFVQPIAPQRRGRDERGRPGVEEALREMASTLQMGGGVGVNLSDLPARSMADHTSGLDPVSVIMKMESNGRSLARTGARRAAQMALLDINHPDIRAVIDLKRHHQLQTVTLSVCIPDAFMRSLGSDSYGPDAATHLWAPLLQAAFDTGNPGVVFIDQVNRDNNLGDIEHLRACNPCGEQYLPDYGACDLGSINLTRLIRRPFTRAASVDFVTLGQLARVAVRALDNVIELTRWPLEQQAREARLTRRIGLGVTGLADALIMLGLRYDRQAGRNAAATMLRTIRNAAYCGSVQLAVERGAFPLFDAHRLLSPPHAASRLPGFIRRRIEKYGLRNSHLLAIAPAGTISLAMADNVSSGIEPVFAPRTLRRITMLDGSLIMRSVDDHALRRLRALRPGRNALPEAWCDASTLRA
ncbi:MAG: ribonucleoside-diphosphate reductase, adenosylcobalamin-dependent, partial [Betaproteobacteria bacterium]|nr:ribonucleoside-diphosphate reductase, adenosylcobalamin-dependent [Betaproteobacteria bacterium]